MSLCHPHRARELRPDRVSDLEQLLPREPVEPPLPEPFAFRFGRLGRLGPARRAEAGGKSTSSLLSAAGLVPPTPDGAGADLEAVAAVAALDSDGSLDGSGRHAGRSVWSDQRTLRGCRLEGPSGPGNGGSVFTYRLHSPDGDDLGEAAYAMQIHPGDEIIGGNAQRFRVVALVEFDGEESPFVGLLQVEAA